MNLPRLRSSVLAAAAAAALSLLASACGGSAAANPSAAAPPPAIVERAPDGSIALVDHPERFPQAAAGARQAAPELNATGVVSPDVSRNIPVVSLSSGRVVEIHARVGDSVGKGQFLMRIQSADVAQAFSDYRQALADERLARAQSERARVLCDRGAVARKDLEVTEDAAAKAAVAVETARTRLRVLGADPERPGAFVDIYAPAAGVITDQNVTAAAGVRSLDNTNLFTISDLSHVWILCDVYENDLPFVRLGEFADIHLAAYPNLVLKGRIGNIGSILDPATRTAKVRLELRNPGPLRLGMFVTAVFHGLKQETRATVPASAVLHLHDRDWVYVPAGSGRFRRVEVTAGAMLPGNAQEIVAGLRPGDRVVANALVLQNTVEQE